MDLLPYPDASDLNPIRVPYLCHGPAKPWRYTIDREEVPSDEAQLEFVSRAHLQRAEGARDPLELATIYQEDVYFGFLAGLLRSHFEVQDFIAAVDVLNLKFVTVARLEGILCQKGPDRDKLSDLDKGLLQDFRLAVRLVSSRVSGGKEIDSTSDHLETLQAVHQSLRLLMWAVEIIYLSKEYIWRDRGVLSNRLLQSGMCEYWRGIYCNKHTDAVIYCLSGLCLGTNGERTLCTAKSCDCYNVHNEKYEARHTTHCHGKKVCQFFGPDMEKVAAMIDEGDIPLIELRRNPALKTEVVSEGKAHTPPITLRVVSHQEHENFVAISHVWAGGLGNPKNNELPMCQIELLYYATSCVPDGLPRFPLEAPFDRQLQEGRDCGPCYIWIDTLCIPVVPSTDSKREMGEASSTSEGVPNQARYDGLKRQAIDSMAFVYRMAACVLVFDPLIQRLCFRRDCKVAAAVSLLACPWMMRCWTFQEGYLSQQLWFVFGSEIVNPRQWLFRLRSWNDSSSYGEKNKLSVLEKAAIEECLRPFWRWSSEKDSESDVLVTDYRYQYEEDSFEAIGDVASDLFHGYKSSAIDGRQSVRFFAYIWNELATRTTTQRTDLHGILAVLLGLSAREIFSSATGSRSPGQRMAMVLRGRQYLPLAMLLQIYPRDTQLCPGIEWLPAFPTRSESEITLDPVDGNMKWRDNPQGWSWRLSDTDSVLFILSDMQDMLGIGVSFQIRTTRPSGRQAVEVSVQGQNSLAHPLEDSNLPVNQTVLCFFCHRFDGDTSWGTGAAFMAKKADILTENIALKYRCPISWSAVEDSGSYYSYLPERDGQALSGLFDCMLYCDRLEWPVPKFHRPNVAYLQKNIVKVLDVLITATWMPFIWILYTNPEVRFMNRFVAKPLMGLFDRYFSSQIPGEKWVFLRGYLWFVVWVSLNWARLLDYLIPITSRTVMFNHVECSGILENVYLDYCEHLAATGYLGPVRLPQGSTKTRHTRGRIRSYQYSKLRQISLPFMVAGVCFLPPWERLLGSAIANGYTMRSAIRVTRAIGKFIILEMGVRVTAEVLWRTYFAGNERRILPE
ncbi:Fc.00g025460.m01.CDS01 [Cosmosporella sp. VM-42]